MLESVQPKMRSAPSEVNWLFHLAEVAQLAHAEGDLVTAEAFIALAYATADIRYEYALVMEDAAVDSSLVTWRRCKSGQGESSALSQTANSCWQLDFTQAIEPQGSARPALRKSCSPTRDSSLRRISPDCAT